MLLGIDIGNTTVEIGFIRSLENITSFKVSSQSQKSIDDWLFILFNAFSLNNLDKTDIKKVVIASTVPILEDKIAIAVEKFLNIKPIVLGQDLQIPIKNRYKKPEEVGIDRLLNGYAGIKLYNPPLIVVDLGTAITFDVVNRNGEYEGGAIFPGINASIEALFSRTAKLPKVNLKNVENLIGKTTKESIQSGLFFGYISLIDGMIEKINKEVGYKHNIILTGGNGDIFSPFLKNPNVYDRYLALKGMYYINDEEKFLKQEKSY